MKYHTNLLLSALTIIEGNKISYRKFSGLTTNDFGVSTHTYGPWRTVKGSQQPGIVSSFGGKCIELKDYKELGLDWSRRHITVWMPNVVIENTTERNGCDQVKIGNSVFNVLQVENWHDYDGWIRAYCVEDKTFDDSPSS